MKNLPFTITAVALSGLLLAGCAGADKTVTEGVNATAEAPASVEPTTVETADSATEEETTTAEATDAPQKGSVSTKTVAPKDEDTSDGRDVEADQEKQDNKSTAAPVDPKKRFTTTVEGDTKFTNNIPLNGVSENKHGKYGQTTVRADKEYMTFSDSVASTELKEAVAKGVLKRGEVETIQRQAMTFIAEEGLDSELNGANNVDAWWNSNKSKIHPDFADKVKKDLKAKDGGTFLVRASTDTPYFQDADHGRMTTRDLSLQNVHYTEAGEYSALLFTVDFSMAMPVKTKDDNKITHLTSGTLTYSLAKDGKTWKFAEWDNSYQTKEVKG